MNRSKVIPLIAMVLCLIGGAIGGYESYFWVPDLPQQIMAVFLLIVAAYLGSEVIKD